MNCTVYHCRGYTASCAASRDESWEKFIFNGVALSGIFKRRAALKVGLCLLNFAVI